MVFFLWGCSGGLLYIGTGSVMVSCAQIKNHKKYDCQVNETSVMGLIKQQRLAIDVKRAKMATSKGNEGETLYQPFLVTPQGKVPILSGSSNMKTGAQRRLVKSINSDIKTQLLHFDHRISRWNIFGWFGLLWSLLSIYATWGLIFSQIFKPFLILDSRQKQVKWRASTLHGRKRSSPLSDVMGFQVNSHLRVPVLQMVLTSGEKIPFGQWHALDEKQVHGLAQHLNKSFQLSNPQLDKNQLPSPKLAWWERLSKEFKEPELNVEKLPLLIPKGSPLLRKIATIALAIWTLIILESLHSSYQDSDWDISLLIIQLVLFSTFLRGLIIRNYKISRDKVTILSDFILFKTQKVEWLSNYAGLLIREKETSNSNESSLKTFLLILKHKHKDSLDLTLQKTPASTNKKLKQQTQLLSEKLNLPLLENTLTSLTPNSPNNKKPFTNKDWNLSKNTDFSPPPPRLRLEKTSKESRLITTGVKDKGVWLIFSTWFGAFGIGLLAVMVMGVMDGHWVTLIALPFAIGTLAVPTILVTAIYKARNLLIWDDTRMQACSELLHWKKNYGSPILWSELQGIEIAEIQKHNSKKGLKHVLRITANNNQQIDYAEDEDLATLLWLKNFLAKEWGRNKAKGA